MGLHLIQQAWEWISYVKYLLRSSFIASQMWHGHLVHLTSQYLIAFMWGYRIYRAFLTKGRTTKEVKAHIGGEFAAAEVLCSIIKVVLHVFKKAQILKESLFLCSIFHVKTPKCIEHCTCENKFIFFFIFNK